MSAPFAQVLRVIGYEALRYRRLVVAGLVLINAVVIGVALIMPPKYQSSTTIFVEQKNVIQPLMQGAAVSTDVRDQSKLAREIIFSRKLMTQALEQVGWLSKNQTDLEQEQIIEATKARTTITNVGPNLIRIEYRESNPERAFQTTQKFAEMFIADSLLFQASESQSAFDFIERQVNEYHEKLVQAEQQLKDFRVSHIDARPGSDADISKRIDTLQSTIEKTTLDLKESKIKESSIEKQLSGEAEVSVSVSREGQLITRIAELQGQVDSLRLTYHDTYPDIVRIKHQIEDLREEVVVVRKQREEARKNPKTASQITLDDSARLNPVYQQLKQQLFDTRTHIETLNTRLHEHKALLQSGISQATRVHGGEATLMELTRDYEVNRDIYQDLLKRRENARVSRSLDHDKQSQTMRIHEPAYLPLQKSGIRFLHLAVAGLLLSIVVPIGVLYALTQVDPRIRFESVISTRLKLPVLGVVPHLWFPKDTQLLFRELQWIGTALSATIIVLLLFGVLRTTQVL